LLSTLALGRATVDINHLPLARSELLRGGEAAAWWATRRAIAATRGAGGKGRC